MSQVIMLTVHTAVWFFLLSVLIIFLGHTGEIFAPAYSQDTFYFLRGPLCCSLFLSGEINFLPGKVIEKLCVQFFETL